MKTYDIFELVEKYFGQNGWRQGVNTGDGASEVGGMPISSYQWWGVRGSGSGIVYTILGQEFRGTEAEVPDELLKQLEPYFISALSNHEFRGCWSNREIMFERLAQCSEEPVRSWFQAYLQGRYGTILTALLGQVDHHPQVRIYLKGIHGYAPIWKEYSWTTKDWEINIFVIYEDKVVKLPILNTPGIWSDKEKEPFRLENQVLAQGWKAIAFCKNPTKDPYKYEDHWHEPKINLWLPEQP